MSQWAQGNHEHADLLDKWARRDATRAGGLACHRPLLHAAHVLYCTGRHGRATRHPCGERGGAAPAHRHSSRAAAAAAAARDRDAFPPKPNRG